MITELFLLTNVRLLVCVVFSFEFECAYDLSESLPNAHYSYVQINWELSPPPTRSYLQAQTGSLLHMSGFAVRNKRGRLQKTFVQRVDVNFFGLLVPRAADKGMSSDIEGENCRVSAF